MLTATVAVPVHMKGKGQLFICTILMHKLCSREEFILSENMNLDQSIYCESCESRFEEEHVTCRKLNMQKLDTCLDRCDTFNKTCENDCFVEYHYDTRVSFRHLLE